MLDKKKNLEIELINITPEEFRDEFINQVRTGAGTPLTYATADDIYYALSMTVRKYIAQRRVKTTREFMGNGNKLVAYMSAEYLTGNQLENNLLNSGLEQIVKQVFEELDIDYKEIVSREPEPGLGNGGLGRLAACYIDSLATKSISGIAYGIRYEYGIFKQVFENGAQVEKTDNWLQDGNPWEIMHPQQDQVISFGGKVETSIGSDGKTRYAWIPEYSVRAIPVDYLVPGYCTEHVNLMRLWTAKSTNELDLGTFNKGFFHDAAKGQVQSENITKVLYPEDSTFQGKELRLKQQYFFASASIRDVIRRFYEAGDEGDNPNPDLTTLPKKVTFQLNDTHPVIAVPELMRVLIDEYDYSFETAWSITSKCFNYTCHTLLSEALEVWDVELIQSLLPRHMQLIYEINKHFLDQMAEKTDDILLLADLSIIREIPFRAVRMANLATIVSTKVNGVAELHSQLLRDKVLHKFALFFPEKFTNVTNGVTPRRFIKVANHALSALITDTIGHGWAKDLDRLKELEKFADDPAFIDKIIAVKKKNKARLRTFLHYGFQMDYNPETLTDVMVKRLHEYKRQTLKLLHIVTIYQKFITNELTIDEITPRTVIFGAKAAPGYQMAKETIKLINSVARKINKTPGLNERLKVLFIPNYNVTAAEHVIPAADLSEQISQAGKEASGTGNMKFALNGALTVGTLDGANIEIRNLVKPENFYLFGMTEPEVSALEKKGYNPRDYYETNPSLKAAIDLISKGEFEPKNDPFFNGNTVVLDLLTRDRFMALADYQAYIDIQNVIAEDYKDEKAWARKALLNIARSGFFSSDRAIQDYLDQVWHATQVFPDWEPSSN